MWSDRIDSTNVSGQYIHGRADSRLREGEHADQNLDRQRAAIRDAEGGEPDRWFEDQASGKAAARAGLGAMLGHLRDGDRLIITSMDRLGRSTLDCLRLVEDLTGRGVQVRFLKEGITAGTGADPRSEFTLTILAAVAPLERSMIRERQAEGIAQAKTRGVYRGRSKVLKPDQVEEARGRVSAGVPLSLVAREAGVSRTVMDDVVKGRRAYSQNSQVG